MGLRRKSREIALQFLFGYDFHDRVNDENAVDEEITAFCDNFEAGKKTLPYAKKLIVGICTHRKEIDSLLADHSHNWRIERMSLVDRNILRIAAYEMHFATDVPANVAINEALEIAKRYSVADSISFVNGILDALQSGQRSKG